MESSPGRLRGQVETQLFQLPAVLPGNRPLRGVGPAVAGVPTMKPRGGLIRESPAVTHVGAGITLLICDDHPAFAQGLAAILADEAEDFDIVGIARSGEEAERMVRELLPDIVLMDVRMPGAGGIEATRRIRAASPTTIVTMLTVSDETSDLYAALKAGATGYVLKDSEVGEIAGAVRSVRRGHLVIPAELAGRFVQDLDAADANALGDPERAILAAIARGETNKEIAARMHVSERTVKRRVEDIYSKLHLADRLEAAIYAATRGLSDESERR